MNFIDDGIDDVEYKQINRTILDGNVTKMTLVISKVKFGTTDSEETSCHG